jgi:chromosomal replication initiation ATPase DnaA
MYSGRQRRDAKAAELAAGVVAYATGVELVELLSPTRGAAGAATARQAAMYLTHVAFEMSLGRVAAAFGRDRSTVAHACHVMEERRDDAELDVWLDAMEAALKGAPPPLSPPASLGLGEGLSR